MTLEEILRVPTAATSQDLADDIWDEDNRLSYSADGEKLLDAENFPSEVTVREGCRILCDGVFAFQDYMAEDRRIGEEIPLDERNSFLDSWRASSFPKASFPSERKPSATAGTWKRSPARPRSGSSAPGPSRAASTCTRSV